MQKTILVTGGAGYIGSHTLVELLENNQNVLVLDNLCNANPVSLSRVEKITGRPVTLIKGDVRDRSLLDQLFANHSVDAVIHFAGLKAVSESITQPDKYYDNNVSGCLTLAQAMQSAGVFKLVFSSSATVYGDPAEIPITEHCPLGQPTNAYGWSKLMAERVLIDLAASDNRWSIALLRYFNPVGAHKSGLIGEDPNGIPNNLLPYIAQVSIGRLPELSVFGNDYPTIDGTGVRDYIHVIDLAKGHLAALDALNTRDGAHIWNLGTGTGYSVLQIIAAFEEACGKKIPYQIKSRRGGDIAVCYADPAKAIRELGWQASSDIHQMMQDTWRWQSGNPRGYE